MVVPLERSHSIHTVSCATAAAPLDGRCGGARSAT